MKLFDQEVEFLPKKIWLSDFKFLHIKEHLILKKEKIIFLS